MKKLYEKSEIWFAVVWIVIYVVLTGTLRGTFGDDSPLPLLGVLLLSAVLTVFIRRNGLSEKYGFKAVGNYKAFLYFFPFIILATVNFWPGFSVHYSMPGQLFAVLTMALVGYMEELLFRGLLFRAMEKDNVRSAIIVSAVTFGAGHIVNLLTGQGTADTVLQIAYAVAIGFSFVMVFYKSGSIIPCILTHSLIDVTSTFSGPSTKALDIAVAVIIILLTGGYALYLSKRTDTARS